MNNNINEQKLKMWKQKLGELETALVDAMQRRGEAAREGDLRENAAYQMATEDAEAYRARIQDVKTILTQLEEK